MMPPTDGKISNNGFDIWVGSDLKVWMLNPTDQFGNHVRATSFGTSTSIIRREQKVRNEKLYID